MGKFPNYENNDDVKVNVWGTSHVTEIAFSHIVYHQGNNCSNIPFNGKQSVTDGAVLLVIGFVMFFKDRYTYP